MIKIRLKCSFVQLQNNMIKRSNSFVRKKNHYLVSTLFRFMLVWEYRMGVSFENSYLLNKMRPHIFFSLLIQMSWLDNSHETKMKIYNWSF